MTKAAPQPRPPGRRDVLRRGAKLAYVTPVVIAVLKAEPAFAASGGSKPPERRRPPRPPGAPNPPGPP